MRIYIGPKMKEQGIRCPTLSCHFREVAHRRMQGKEVRREGDPAMPDRIIDPPSRAKGESIRRR
jgi:hypothetical protein